MTTTDLAPDVPSDPAPRPGAWLVDRLHEEQRAADRRRLAELLAAHPVPHARTGA